MALTLIHGTNTNLTRDIDTDLTPDTNIVTHDTILT